MSSLIKVGDVLEITTTPETWNSCLCINNPTHLKYPTVFEVMERKDSHEFPSTAFRMKCIVTNTDYGFSYSGIRNNYTKLKGSLYLTNFMVKNIKDEN